MRGIASAVLAAITLVSSAAANDLAGNWKLLAYQGVYTDIPPEDVMGPNPKGYLVLTPEGRMITLITAGERKPGMADPERAALHKSMLSYSGKYRMEGNTFITTVEISWNEAFNGTEQKRNFRLEGDKLYIETAPQKSVKYPDKTAIGRLVWEREK